MCYLFLIDKPVILPPSEKEGFLYFLKKMLDSFAFFISLVGTVWFFLTVNFNLLNKVFLT